MVRQVQLTIPHGKISDPEVAEEYKSLFLVNDVNLSSQAVAVSPNLRRFEEGTARLDAVLSLVDQTFKLKYEVYNGSDHDILIFRSHQYKLQSIIATLQKTLGLGVHWGRIDTVALASTIPPLEDDSSVSFR